MTRIVLITGANRGIGRELAAQLAHSGDTVLLGSRDLEAGAQAAVEIDGEVHLVQIDITDDASVEAAASAIEASHGRLDVLVNNAAGIFDRHQWAHNADLTIVAQALDLNLIGAWRVTLAMLPLLRRSESARIVNVSSESGSLERMGGGIPAYRASKAALNAFTRTLASELADDGITVHSVSPGWTATEFGGPKGRPVPDGAASVRHVVDLPARAGTGGFYQDEARLPW
ncbi:SDR family NAD(P)-dependent oxidoreductase [Nesterenkonia sp. CL21]|uniref:SDR family NAD(P)-dependent oxidoreductase n=1 Tax=Nesterenkonia sp. CL21 TaxID=3064894 RepID=UPI00287B40B7|nr:SDR family NAD(P)-dependent oxidoreductase [Nesterenkonia sp. CL21]MDS2171845.1 SDR family NAD(P)-dependent oxidoreductase [Nesterenkonia sp. CL21]